MKSFSFLFFLCLGTLFFATSCGNDDDNPGGDNFTYDGTTYSLSQGLSEDYGDNGNGTTDIDITLLSSGISYNSVTNEFSGSGDGIYLDLNTSSEDGRLAEGTYTFGTSRTDFSLVDAELFIGVDATDENVGRSVIVTDGSVDVSRDGDAMTFIFDLTASDGENITGSFSGVLRNIGN